MEATFLLVVGFTNSYNISIVSLMLAVGFSGFAISGRLIRIVSTCTYYTSMHSCVNIFVQVGTGRSDSH